MPPAPFKVQTPVFEGPLDLLLSLIEKRKLFINDISLAKVADDFIEHVKTFEHYPISDSAHFILVASTLLLLKSKSLLPNLELSEEETQSIEDLERRLKVYQEIKRLSLGIKEKFGRELLFAPEPRPREPIFSPDQTLTVANLLAGIRDVLNSLPKQESLPKAVVAKVISLEEMIDNLTERVNNSLRMSFKEFNRGSANRTHVIVSFLAMLEMVRQGIIRVTQEKLTDDIMMETDKVVTPRY